MTEGIIAGNCRALHVVSLAVTPSSVAANTTAEQTFTLNNVQTFHIPVICKPTAQAGLGIVGARVSAPNTLAITYSNVTGSPIIPTAETYTILLASPASGVASPNIGG